MADSTGWEDVPDAEAGWEEVPKEALPRAAQAQRDFTAINERARKRTSDFVEGTKQFGRELGEKTLERAPAVATGALTGAAVGAAGGPLTALAGGVLGAAGGSAAYDTGKNVSRATGLTEGPQTPTGDIVSNAAEEAKWEAMLGPLGPLLGRLKAAVFAKGTGLTPDALKLAKEAEARGINLGTADVGTGLANRPLENVFGSFPIVGAPSRKAFGRKVGEVDKAADDFVSQIDRPQPLPEMGEDLKAAAGSRYEGVKVRADADYANARFDAAQEGARIPTDNLKRAANSFLQEHANSRAFTEAGEEIDPVKMQPLFEYARKLANIEPHLRVEQYEGLARDFDNLLQNARGQGFNFANTERVREALQRDFQNMSTPGKALQTFNEARGDFAEGRRVFETPAARKFEQVDRNIFGPGYEESGVRNADELMQTAWQTKSPRAMKQLHDIVGTDTFKKALASKIDDAFDQAYTASVVNGKQQTIFDPGKFRQLLGLEGKTKGQAYQSLQEAFNLSKSGVSMQDLEKFLQVAEAAIGRGTPNVSTFLARRASLGGMGAVESATMAGSVAHFGPMAAIPFLVGRRISTVLSSPEYLKDITRLLDPTTPDAIKTAILPRLRRGMVAAPYLSDTPQKEKQQ